MNPRLRMMMVMPMVAALAASMASCGSTRSITLRVSDDAGNPVPCARVRTVALGTSDVPLPITLDNLQEALSKRSPDGTTDVRGEVTVCILSKRAHFVQVLPPLSDSQFLERSVDQSIAWEWFLDLGVEPVGIAPPTEPNPPGMNLQVVR